MGQANLELGSKIFGALFNQMQLLPETRTLAGNVTLVVKSPTLQYMDPGGSGRTITLPAEADSEGLMFFIFNTADGDETLTVNDDAPALVGSVEQGEAGIFVCDGTTWLSLITQGGTTLDGADVDEVADDNIIGGIPVLHRIAIADAASGNTEVTLTHKTRVIDAWCVKTGADGHATEDTITVGAGANAITDAMAIGTPDDKGITRAATIDDANHEIAAAGALRVTWVKGSSGANNTACEVYVLGLRVA